MAIDWNAGRERARMKAEEDQNRKGDRGTELEGDFWPVTKDGYGRTITPVGAELLGVIMVVEPGDHFGKECVRVQVNAHDGLYVVMFKDRSLDDWNADPGKEGDGLICTVYGHNDKTRGEGKFVNFSFVIQRATADTDGPPVPVAAGDGPINLDSLDKEKYY